jgi:hypothetical protein
MIMVARHEPPSHRRQFHARHGLCDDTVARLDIVKDVARDDDMRSSASHGERTDAVDDVEPCFGKRAAHFGGKPPERPSKLPVGGVDQFELGHESLPFRCAITMPRMGDRF